MRNSILAMAAALTAACSTTAAPPPASANPGGGTCNDSTLSTYVGQGYTGELGAEMQSKSGARSLRVVHHGEIVTMEFNADRLTIMLDEQNRVASVRCG